MADPKDRAHQGTSAVADAAKRGVDTAENKAHGLVEKAADLAQQGKDAVSGLVDKGKQMVGNLVDSTGETGQKVQRWAGDAYEATADKVKEGVDGATDLIRKYPIPALLVGFGVGLLIGRLLRG